MEHGRSAPRWRVCARVVQVKVVTACMAWLQACGGGGDAPVAPQGEPPSIVATSPSAGRAAAPPAATGGPGTSFRFSLPANRITSAAVYDAEGRLVRTLWRGEPLASGWTTRVWDQLDDAGRPAPDGPYEVRVVHHGVQYRWTGAIGNSSDRSGGRSHRSFTPPTSFSADSGRLHVALGYNEQQNPIQGFALGSPQVNHPAVSFTDPFSAASIVASDGARLYWANTGGLAKQSFVAAFELGTARPHRFAHGNGVCLNLRPGTAECYADQWHPSVLMHRLDVVSVPTGLAVQRTGPLLAVAYGAEGLVRLFDKVTGAAIGAFDAPLPTSGTNQIAWSPSGDLWVLTADGARRYTGLPHAATPVASIARLARPLSIAVDPQDPDRVWIADGGASQQLKRFDRQGTLLGLFGQAGGLEDNSEVANDRLCFLFHPQHDTERAPLSVDDRGTVWLGDTCNNRILEVLSDGRAGRTVSYLPAVYVATVDPGNPRRVFANFLEFEVTEPSDPRAAPTWRLVRNWLPSLPRELRDHESANWAWGGFRSVVTLSNGRTIAMMQVDGRQVVVELAATGRVAIVQRLRSLEAGETPFVLYESGDLGHALTHAGRQSVMRLALEGFTPEGLPQWAARARTLASVPVAPGTPYYRNGTWTGVVGPRFPVTQDGAVVFFNPSVEAQRGFHLGAASLGSTAWRWQGSPSGPMDGRGTFQTRAEDPTIQYGGNQVLALGRSVIYGYHGEFFTDPLTRRVGQANQFMHFLENGLFIGQFGVPSTRSFSPVEPGLSGNAFSVSLVRTPTQVLLYHNDESTHGGVHRWLIEGLDDVQEVTGAILPGAQVTLR